MYKLIHKDIKLLVNYFVIAVPVSIFFVITFTLVYPGFGYAMGAFGIAAMLVLIIPSIEAKNHTEIIINSLPVLRSEIILTKYLATFVYTAIGLLLVALTGILINFGIPSYHLPYLNWQNVVITLISVSLLVSIYYPLFYRFNNQVVILFLNVIVFQLIFFMPSFVNDYINEHINETLVQQLLQLNMHTPWALPLLGTTIALMLLIISYLFTVKIYTAKDF